MKVDDLCYTFIRHHAGFENFKEIFVFNFLCSILRSMSKQTLSFQAEVAQLLHLVTHALYSNKEIFMRELVSNASDACDKLRFEALNNNALYEDAPNLEVRVSFDKDAKTITIADNGIGFEQQFKEQIFVIFQRLHSNDEYPGTGIGLSVARDIIVQHGGTLTARPSGPVRKLGDRQSWLTTFAIRLPLLDSDGS